MAGQGRTIVYEYGKNLYVNATNRCDLACRFCVRSHAKLADLQSDELWLKKEPTREEILESIRSHDLSRYEELVFCGFGEPTYRIDDFVWVIDRLRELGEKPVTRLDTNGTGSLIAGRDICPMLKDRFDRISISLNTDSGEHYDELCRPHFPKSFEAVIAFADEARQYVPEVTVTVVDCIPKEQIEGARRIAAGLDGVRFRIREYIQDGQ